MPFISRASLGAEFYDITSAMLLRQPLPQYLHAQLMKMALFGELNTPDSLGLPILGRDGIGASGADYGDMKDEQLQLEDPIMSEAITVVPELGKAPGHTIRINRPVYTSTTYTQASRAVANGNLISTTPINATDEQVSLTLQRFFGPYDAQNARVAPFGVDRFDASMPVHKIAGIVGKQLKVDRDRFLDAVGVALFNAVASTNIIYPQGMSTDNSSLVAGDYPLDFETIGRTEKTLDDLGVPTFGNGRRVFIATTKQINDLKSDAQFARLSEFHPPVNPVLSKSYYRTIGAFDIYKSTTLLQTANTNTPAIPIQRGQAFGPGMVGIGAGRLAEVVHSTSDNFGEHALVGWIAYESFGVLDSRFGCSVRSS